MRLARFRVEHFRCLHHIDWISLQDVTAFIGENDGGKSSALDALTLLFNRTAPATGDYSYLPDNPAEQETTIDIFAVLDLSSTDSQAFRDLIGDGCTQLSLHKSFSRDGFSRLSIICEVPSDERFRKDLDKLTIDDLKELAASAEIDIRGRTRKQDIVMAIRSYVQTLSKVQGEIEYPNALIGRLPRVETVASSRAPDPQAQVLRALKSLFQDAIRSDEFSGRLSEIQDTIGKRLNEKVAELKPVIQHYYPEIEEVNVTPVFDFSSGLTAAPLALRAKGGGAVDLGRSGEGKRRQVTMAVFEWQSDLLKEREEEGVQPLILAFDEPDTHLDYDSQRRMFDIMMRFVQPTVQVIVCTHSLNLIDRLPATKICHFSLGERRTTQVSCLRSDDAQTEEMFLDGIGRNLGLSTGTIFHERCFLIVEGETEYNALPVLFHYLFRVDSLTLQSCGVKLLNGENNAGARLFAKFLNDNRRPVVFLVDQDSRVHAPSNKVFTARALEAAGFDLETQVFFIGEMEFEDAFSDSTYARMANRFFAKSDGLWRPEDFAALRDGSKFSDNLKRLLKTGKPDIGYCLAKSIDDETDIPSVIKDLFRQARKLAHPSEA